MSQRVKSLRRKLYLQEHRNFEGLLVGKWPMVVWPLAFSYGSDFRFLCSRTALLTIGTEKLRVACFTSTALSGWSPACLTLFFWFEWWITPETMILLVIGIRQSAMSFCEHFVAFANFSLAGTVVVFVRIVFAGNLAV